VLLVEHDMKLVMNVTHMICVLNYGRKIAFGEPADIQRNQEVVAAYLGDTRND
jgi:branched-chain amino acid transport system ATP-binding protein